VVHVTGSVSPELPSEVGGEVTSNTPHPPNPTPRSLGGYLEVNILLKTEIQQTCISHACPLIWGLSYLSCRNLVALVHAGAVSHLFCWRGGLLIPLALFCLRGV
jgi:hypothetical protein